MNILKIEGSFKNPDIKFDPGTGILEIKGNSIPENSDKFYEPVKNWLAEYLQNPKEGSSLHLKIVYLNSASVRHVLNILELIEEYCKKGNVFPVNWYYEEDDEDILDSGKLYQQLVGIPINLVPVPSED